MSTQEFLSKSQKINHSEQPPIDDHLIRFTFPQVHQRTLDNGLTVYWIEDHRIPKVWIRLGFDFGTKCEQQEKAGLLELLAYTLRKGTAKRRYLEIIETIENAGGELDVAVSRDFFFVYGDFLAEGVESGLEIFSEVVQTPQFPHQEVEKERMRMIADLENEKTSPNFLANRRMNKLLYHPHPYALQKTRNTLEQITREDLLEIHARYFQPEGAHLIFAGDVNEKQALELAEKYFGNWQGMKNARKQFPPPRGLSAPVIHLVHRPGSEQVTLLLGNLLFPRNHPDFERMLVMNRILGGGGSGRLFMYLREEKGFTYGAYSTMRTNKDAGVWLAQADVRPDVVLPALEGFQKQFRRMREEPVSRDDLESARRYLIGVFPLQNETPASVAALALQRVLYELPPHYWDEYLERLYRVAVTDVQEVARRYIVPEKMATVVVGDADTLLPELQKLGAVEVFDANDEMLRR